MFEEADLQKKDHGVDGTRAKHYRISSGKCKNKLITVAAQSEA
jgi:hypothetical protein